MLTAEHIDNSIADALSGESPLDPAALDILGFATPTMRRMFSNLCNLKGLTYLEVGTYAGATLCSAASNNPCRVFGIENFSQSWHEGRDIRAEFTENSKRFAPDATLLVGDCFHPGSPILHANEPIHIFYFDGDHTQQAQGRALPHFFDALADTFLFIVDDYNWQDVWVGTGSGFSSVASRVSIIHERILIGEIAQDDPVWHNGIALFLCKKI